MRAEQIVGTEPREPVGGVFVRLRPRRTEPHQLVDRPGMAGFEVADLRQRALGDRLAGDEKDVAGARPTKSVQQLQGVGIEVSGWLDDIRSAYERGRIMVVPLVIGAGLQNKILEAMSMGVPCVTTELVNSAIGAVPGEEILIASTAQEFADQTMQLLTSPELYERISTAGRQLVQSRYSWQAVGDSLISAFARKVPE